MIGKKRNGFFVVAAVGKTVNHYQRLLSIGA